MHAVSFAFTGIYMYLGYQALCNPMVTDVRALLVDHVSPVGAGSFTMAHVPKTFELCAALTTRPFPLGWLGSMVPSSAAFITVKGLGTGDWGEKSLTPFERYLNGLGPRPEA